MVDGNTMAPTDSENDGRHLMDTDNNVEVDGNTSINDNDTSAHSSTSANKENSIPSKMYVLCNNIDNHVIINLHKKVIGIKSPTFLEDALQVLLPITSTNRFIFFGCPVSLGSMIEFIPTFQNTPFFRNCYQIPYNSIIFQLNMSNETHITHKKWLVEIKRLVNGIARKVSKNKSCRNIYVFVDEFIFSYITNDNSKANGIFLHQFLKHMQTKYIELVEKGIFSSCTIILT